MLLVGAGASVSVKDVENGYFAAFKEMGVDVKLYLLDRHLATAKRWLNLKWRDRGKPYDQRPTWPDAIYRAGVEALEMALRFEVDWVLAISGMFLHPDVLEMMRRAGLRTAVLFTESPYDDIKQGPIARLADMCWTNERTSVNYLRQFNSRVGYLRAAYDPVRHTPVAKVDTSVPAHDVVFVGTGFQERIDILSAVDWSGIDLGLYGTWTLLAPKHKLRQYLKGGLLDNEKTVALYRQATIGLNLHRTSIDYAKVGARITDAESMNPRAYELAACGVFQVSDGRREVHETFGSSVPTFSAAGELEEKIRRFLDAPGARSGLATAARRCIEPHTFAARAAQVLADLEQYEQPIAKGA